MTLTPSVVRGFAGASVFCMAVIVFCLSMATSYAQPNYVIHISVDGLRPDAVTTLGAAALPSFYRLRNEGAITDNARTDLDYTITLPNHSSQITGRPVLGPTGHNWINNVDPNPGQTLHSNKGSYVASAFDVAHDNGLRTGAFVTKTKFSLFDTSYNSTNGAPDTIGANNGQDKIDHYFYNSTSSAITSNFLGQMNSVPLNYSFLHFHDPDTAGHANDWDLSSGSAYLNAVQNVEQQLAAIFGLIDSSPVYSPQNTTIILTADHGGVLNTPDHSNAAHADDYTIPFYVWGAGVSAGSDLYSLNPASRLNPGSSRPTYAALGQPIRNGDAANLALDLLGLESVPGSTINNAQALAVPEAGIWGVALMFGLGLMLKRRSVQVSSTCE